MIKRSFGVLKFLNREHIWPVRVLAACAGGAIALLTTGKPVLAREMFGQFYNGLFKLGGRRSGFYLNAGWPRRTLAFDPFFNFTEGLPPETLLVLKEWLQARSAALPIELFAGHMMLVEAAQAHAALERDEQGAFEVHLGHFKHYADMLLAVGANATPAPEQEDTSAGDSQHFAQNAGDVLSALEQVLPIETWNWFVIGGTFLGLVRDNGFLAHDVDLDVGVMLDGLDLVALEAAFAQSDQFSIAKFDYQTEIYRDEAGHAKLRRVPGMLKVVHSNGINLDVFVHERRDGKIWHGSGVNKWVNAAFTLSEYELNGQKVLGPQDADLYLREHYGDWRVVVKEFSCITGTTNLAFVKNLMTIAVLLKRYAHFAKTRPQEAEKVLRELTEQGYVEAKDGALTLANRVV